MLMVPREGVVVGVTPSYSSQTVRHLFISQQTRKQRDPQWK